MSSDLHVYIFYTGKFRRLPILETSWLFDPFLTQETGSCNSIVLRIHVIDMLIIAQAYIVSLYPMPDIHFIILIQISMDRFDRICLNMQVLRITQNDCVSIISDRPKLHDHVFNFLPRCLWYICFVINSIFSLRIVHHFFQPLSLRSMFHWTFLRTFYRHVYSAT